MWKSGYKEYLLTIAEGLISFEETKIGLIHVVAHFHGMKLSVFSVSLSAKN